MNELAKKYRLGLLPLNMQYFAVTNTTESATEGNNLSAEMKTFYSDYLIDLAGPLLIHDQFGQKQNIPKNGGKTIEFRKYTPLAKALTPLTEGVTPEGDKLDVSTVTATVKQYGNFIQLSDLLILTAIDNNIVQATEMLGENAGRTLDTITREVINAGTNVQHYDGSVTDRGSITKEHKLNVDCIKRAVRSLKIQNTPKIDGDYVSIIHPDAAYDLTNDEKWVEANKYVTPEKIHNGEIGKVEGVRFCETTEAKVFAKEGAGGIDVYSTLVLGKNAYGVTEITGGGLQHIVKQLGSAGTADPLNQRATAGWKATKTAEILVDQYMVRIETASSFDVGAN